MENQMSKEDKIEVQKQIGTHQRELADVSLLIKIKELWLSDAKKATAKENVPGEENHQEVHATKSVEEA